MKSLHSLGDWLAPKRVLVTGRYRCSAEVDFAPKLTFI